MRIEVHKPYLDRKCEVRDCIKAARKAITLFGDIGTSHYSHRDILAMHFTCVAHEDYGKSVLETAYKEGKYDTSEG